MQPGNYMALINRKELIVIVIQYLDYLWYE